MGPIDYCGTCGQGLNMKGEHIKLGTGYAFIDFVVPHYGVCEDDDLKCDECGGYKDYETRFNVED